jgi:asparagine synthase (glutamine-hydrolysing)
VGVLRNLDNRWRDNISKVEKELVAKDMSQLQKVQTLDIKYWMPNNLLTKLDRCLMAHGVEGRVPFLDLSVSRFGFCLNDKQKTSGRLGKVFLRGWLAKNCAIAKPLHRKQGFSAPILNWLLPHAPTLGCLVAKQPGVEQHCVPEAVEGLFRSIRPSTAQAVWLLLFYALWHQCHIVGVDSGGTVQDILLRS